MRFGIKQKILIVLVGVLALTTALDALLASYFTNRQNQESAFTALSRELLAWQDDLSSSTARLREIALATVSETMTLDQLAEVVTIQLKLHDPTQTEEIREIARALAYSKSVSLNRLHLVLRTGGFSSIAVYDGGRLSYYVSASNAGMAVDRRAAGDAWVGTDADADGNLPFQSWPAWSDATPPPTIPATLPDVTRPAVSFGFPSPADTAIEIAVPVQGVIKEYLTDAELVNVRIASNLAIAGLPAASADNLHFPQPAVLAVVVFRKLIDRAALEELARKTGSEPAIFSPDGVHRQQLAEADNGPAALPLPPLGMSSEVAQRTVAVQGQSFYQTLLPWRFENETRLVLGLSSSRDSTLQNIWQTVMALLSAAGLVLLLSIALGIFWVGRFIDPIVALTAAVKAIGPRSRSKAGAHPIGWTGTEELRLIMIEAPDEVGDLTAAFNAMIAELRQSFETLEQRVQVRTAELRQQTRYLQTLFDTLPLSVWLKDTASRYLAVNESCAEACGLDVEAMVGKSDLDLWPPDRAAANQADDAAVMASRLRRTVEEPLAGPDGTVWIESDKAPVLDEDGTVLGIVGIARNISERKAAEAAREAALAEAVRLASLRSEFMAQMSHELRTPLNAILGYAQILRRDRLLTSRQATGLATIHASGQHLLTLINDILDLSRIEAGKLELRPAEVDLAGFLRVVADIIRVKAEEKSLLFTHETAGDLPTAVRVDDKRLRQVLLNLLGNAVKFTDGGTVVLRATRRPGAPADGEPLARLRFEVEDSGVGMTAVQLERIFQPFEQVGELPRREGGAGLGLAISRQLVRLMGGDIAVRSEIGKGSRFWFELDLPVIDNPLASASEERIMLGYAGPRRRVLIVDDVPQNRAMLMDALSSFGFDVFDAVNGREGLELAERIRPDLIVMDVMMPVMDGLEATRRIRALPALARIPIIGVTASAAPADEARSYAAGVDAFVPKPIATDLLLRLIGEHLHLVWIYDEIAREPETAGDGAADPVPPQEEMETLHRLALEGYMRPIRERADHLMGLDPCYQPFATRLMRLAEGYQSKAILALIERHLK